ncbi:MAG: phosphatase PAP2 family protein [Alphaproteobacteria bacterium]|nr:phosphatase PAP2 family protein [Alphaproteobacteria bacterium]
MSTLAAIIAFDQRLAQALLPLRELRWLRIGAKLTSIVFAGPVCFLLYAASYLAFSELRELLHLILLAEAFQLGLIALLRNMTRRTRPAGAEKLIYYPRWNRYSFPSLHASRSAMLCLAVSLFYSWPFVLLAPLAALCAASRLLLQKHFLTDVLCGATIGLLASFLSAALLS